MAQLTGAKSYPNAGVLDRGLAFKLLDGVAAATNGTGDEPGVPILIEGLPDSFGVQVVIAGGTLSALSVDLEGTIDGVNWFQIFSFTDPEGGYSPVFGNKIKAVRANKKSATGSSGAPTVTLYIVF